METCGREARGIGGGGVIRSGAARDFGCSRNSGELPEKIADNILKKFGSFERLGGLPLERLYEIKGMGDSKIIRLAAALEIARRVALATDAEKAATAAQR